MPIGFQITLQVVSVVRAIQNIVINHKKYSEIMKKVFRKIQKGTTKMIERIKSLGEMETKQKCVVQRFEIIIPSTKNNDPIYSLRKFYLRIF